MATHSFYPCFIVTTALALAACGPNKNKIRDWLDNIELGTRYHMEERISAGGNTESYAYDIRVTDVDRRSDRTVLRLNYDDWNAWFIADAVRDAMFLSWTETVTDDDMRMLRTPVEEGTQWLGILDSYILEGTFSNVSFRIDSTGGERDVGSLTAKDVVTVKVGIPTPSGVSMPTAEYYYSPTYGWLGDRYVIRVDGASASFETLVRGISLP